MKMEIVKKGKRFLAFVLAGALLAGQMPAIEGKAQNAGDAFQMQGTKLYGTWTARDTGGWESQTPVENVTDGDTSTYYDGEEGSWIQIESEEAVPLTGVRIVARGSGFEYRLSGVQIQGSGNGENWDTLYTIQAEEVVSNPSYTDIRLSVSDETQTYQYFRVYGADNHLVNIAELEFWAELSGHPRMELKALIQELENTDFGSYTQESQAGIAELIQLAKVAAEDETKTNEELEKEKATLLTYIESMEREWILTTDDELIRKGNWQEYADTALKSNLELYTTNAGDSVEFQFNGIGFEMYSNKNSGLSYADIYIDGQLAQDNVSLYQRLSPGSRNQLITTVSGLSDETHTAKIVLAEEANENGRVKLSVDAFKIIRDAAQYSDPAKADIFNVDFTNGTTDTSPLQNGEGQKVGSPVITASEELDKNIVQFDGNSAYTYGFSPEKCEKISENVTMECMVKFHDIPGSSEKEIFSMQQSGGIGLGLNYGKLTFFAHVGGGYREPSTVIREGKWYHIVGVVSATDVRLYVNGGLRAINTDAGNAGITYPAQSNALKFVLGGDSSGSELAENMAKADLSFARIYSRPLSEQQIRQLSKSAFEGINIPCEDSVDLGLIASDGIAEEANWNLNLHVSERMLEDVDKIEYDLVYDNNLLEYEQMQHLKDGAAITQTEEGRLHVAVSANVLEKDDFKKYSSTRIGKLTFKTKAVEENTNTVIRTENFQAFYQDGDVPYSASNQAEKTLTIYSENMLDKNGDGVIGVGDVALAGDDLKAVIAEKAAIYPYKHAVILTIDGAGAVWNPDSIYYANDQWSWPQKYTDEETMAKRKNTYAMQLLNEEFATSYTAKSVIPAISAQNYFSILHGVPWADVPAEYQVDNDSAGEYYFADFGVEEPRYPSVFRTVTQAFPERQNAAFSEWAKILNGIIEPDTQVAGSVSEESRSFYDVADYITSPAFKNTAVVFAQNDHMDHIGHGQGYFTDAYWNELQQYDEQYKAVMDALAKNGYSEDTLIITNADHGGHQQDHGSEDDCDRDVFIGVWGQTVNSGARLEGGSNADISPIALTALRTAKPDSMTGKVFDENMFLTQEEMSTKNRNIENVTFERGAKEAVLVLGNAKSEIRAIDAVIDLQGNEVDSVRAEGGTVLRQTVENGKLKLTISYEEQPVQLAKILYQAQGETQPVLEEIMLGTKDGKEVYPDIQNTEKPVPTLESIEVTAPKKIEYEINEKLDLTGMAVTAIYSDGTTQDVTDKVEITGFDSASAGEKTITVTYEGKTATFKVTVKDESILEDLKEAIKQAKEAAQKAEAAKSAAEAALEDAKIQAAEAAKKATDAETEAKAAADRAKEAAEKAEKAKTAEEAAKKAAAEAAENAADTEEDRKTAEAAQTAAEAAKQAAEAAKREAVTAKTEAEAAKAAAQTAQSEAKKAQDASEAAQREAEAAKAAAEEARDAAAQSAENALEAKEAAEAAQKKAVDAQKAAETNAAEASEANEAAGKAKAEAEAAAAKTEIAKNLAEAQANVATKAADESKAYAEKAEAAKKAAEEAAKRAEEARKAAEEELKRVQEEAEKKLAEMQKLLKETAKSILQRCSDFQAGSWYEDYVVDVYLRGYMTGMNADYFGINETLVRAQFAVILYRMAGEPEVEFKENFADVKDGQFYSDAVTWASEQGIITGYEDSGLFGPNDTITREQMATIMYRYADAEMKDTDTEEILNSFPDAGKVSGFAKEALAWCVEEGIITGKKAGDEQILDAQGHALRVECAAMISRFVKVYNN